MMRPMRSSRNLLADLVSTAMATTALACLLSACASSGPVVPVPPTVRVTQLDSLLITPEAIHFQARIAIENRMRAGLQIQKVDWGADLHDRPLFDESLAELRPMRARGSQTVTFPFQIVMGDIVDQAVDVLAEESIRVSFRGVVYPVGFAPIPFEATRVIPCPKLPSVSLDGAEGSPLDGAFTVFLRIRNTNGFPMAVESVDSYLAINGKRYGLLQTREVAEMGPGAAARVGLTMQQTRGKALSMVVNVLGSRTPRFELGGSFSCRTPYGVIHVPLALSSEALASAP